MTRSSSDPLDRPATRERLRVALAAIGAAPEASARAAALVAATPGGAAWARFVFVTGLALGTGLVLSGVVSFFAFNWATLGRFGKFALIEGAIVGCAAAAWRRLPAFSGQLALGAAAVLVGPLLAVYGQTYQTGADPWGLFAAWAGLILPWALLARFTALWVLLVTLVDTALVLYVIQVIEPRDRHLLFVPVAIAALHGLIVALWEWQRSRPRPWLEESWGPRLAAAAGFACLVVPAAAFVLSGEDFGMAGPVGALALALAAALVAVFYRQRRVDLFMLTAAAGSVGVVVTALVGRLVFRDLDLILFGFMVMTLVIVGEIALIVAWLRRISRDTGVSEGAA